MKTHTPTKYLTVSEAASYCSLSEKTIRRLIGRGVLPYYRATRRIQIAISDLDAYFATVRVDSVDLDLLAVR